MRPFVILALAALLAPVVAAAPDLHVVACKGARCCGDADGLVAARTPLDTPPVQVRLRERGFHEPCPEDDEQVVVDVPLP